MILDQFGMMDSNPVTTLIATGTKLFKATANDITADSNEYQSNRVGQYEMIAGTKCTTKKSKFKILSTIITMGHRRSKKQSENKSLVLQALEGISKRR